MDLRWMEQLINTSHRDSSPIRISRLCQIYTVFYPEAGKARDYYKSLDPSWNSVIGLVPRNGKDEKTSAVKP